MVDGLIVCVWIDAQDRARLRRWESREEVNCDGVGLCSVGRVVVGGLVLCREG